MACWPSRLPRLRARTAKPLLPDAPLPGSSPVIDVSAPEQALYRIAVPDLGGTAGLGSQGAGVLRSDFALVSLFKVLDPASFVANLATEGLSITPASGRRWAPRA